MRPMGAIVCCVLLAGCPDSTVQRGSRGSGGGLEGPTTSEGTGSAGTDNGPSATSNADNGPTGGGDPTTGSGSDAADAAPSCKDDRECGMFDDACVVGACDGGVCVAQPFADGIGCDDGLYCTVNDACVQGVCGGEVRPCESTAQCSMGACNEIAGSCEQVPDQALAGTACDDGDPCTGDGTCNAGACEPGADACGAMTNDCQVGTCEPGGCTTMPVNDTLPCNVDNACGVSACSAGSCVVVTALTENAACDDGLWCTYYERCIAGVCTPNGESPCLGDQGCGTWTCDDDLDTCVVEPDNEGGDCDDNRSCTAGTTCTAGACGGGVGPTPIFFEDFANNDQGWNLGPEWEIGPAQQTACDQDQGCNSVAPAAFPGGDPALDHTPTEDNGVAGVAIGGIIDQSALHEQYYLQSPPFDATAPGALVFSYYRWLNSDYTDYMENRVEVFDGAAWQTLWVTGGPPGITDAPWASSAPGEGWYYQEFDVSEFKNPQMQVRFGFNVGAGGVYPAPSWNIDDVFVAVTGCPDGA